MNHELKERSVLRVVRQKITEFRLWDREFTTRYWPWDLFPFVAFGLSIVIASGVVAQAIQGK